MQKERKVIELAAVNKTERATQEIQQGLKKTAKEANRLSRSLKDQSHMFGRTEKAAGGYGRTMQAVSGRMKGFAAVAGTALAAAFSVSTINNIADYGDKLDKLGLRIGTTADYLSEMRFVAEQTGLNIETFGTAMQRATRRINEAAHGTGEARAALVELGLDAKKLNALPLDQKFNAIADAIDGLGDQSDKVRIAMKLFDTEGVALVQTMEGGSLAIEALREEGRRLGVTMSDLQADKMAAMNDATNRLSKAFLGMAQDLVADVAPAITTVADRITDWITGTDSLTRVQLDHRTSLKEITELYKDNSAAARENAEATRLAAVEQTRATIAALEAKQKLIEASKESVPDSLPGMAGMISPDFKDNEIDNIGKQADKVGVKIAQLRSNLYELEKPIKNVTSAGGGVAGAIDDAGKKSEAAAVKNTKLADSYRRVTDAVNGTNNAIDTRQIPELILKPYSDHSAHGFSTDTDKDKPLPEFLKAEAAADSTAAAIKDSFSGAAKDIITNFDNLEDVGKNILSKLANSLLDSGLNSLSGALFGGGAAGGGGLIGGAVNSGISAVTGGGLGSMFGGFFADGGHLAPGKIGVVGEEGPEFIYGGNSGKTIVPMKGGGGQGASTPAAAPIINITVNGGSGDEHIKGLVHQGVVSGISTYDKGLMSRITEKNAREG